MLSAIVLACDAAEPRLAPPRAVVASVSALVPAVVAGLVREASLAATAGNEALHQIADYAGCRLVEATAAADVLQAAVTAAPGPLILILQAGCVPEHGFVEELADFMSMGADLGALLRQSPPGGLARLFPSFAPAAALIGARSAMRKNGGRSLAALAKALRPERAFRCRAIRIG
jgi:hypothetical protein